MCEEVRLPELQERLAERALRWRERRERGERVHLRDRAALEISVEDALRCSDADLCELVL